MIRHLIVTLLLTLTPMILLGADITFKVDNLKNNKGLLIAGIYNDSETFAQSGKEIIICFSQIPLQNKRGVVKCQIERGEVAAIIFHDENKDFELNQSIFGIPNEGIGFSGNADVETAGFNESKFRVEDKPLELMIKLRYF